MVEGRRHGQRPPPWPKAADMADYVSWGRKQVPGPILGVSCACTTADFHPARGPCVFDAALGEKRMQLTFMRVTDCSDGKGPPPPLKGLGCEE